MLLRCPLGVAYNRDVQIDTLYEDPYMLVVNKPAGIPVHAGPKGGPNVEDLIAARFDPRRRTPSLAHRLDRDTSGCLVLGKTKPALARLHHLFASRQAKKTYWAITDGVPAQREGVIDAKLAKRSHDPRSWWMEVRDDGQDAVTEYTILTNVDGRALLALHPQTGRTHQIRVHLAHIGCPVLGDPLYGKEGETGLMLHARSLFLPFDKETQVDVFAPLPPVFADALKRYTLVTKE